MTEDLGLPRDVSGPRAVQGQMGRFVEWYNAHGQYLGIGRASCHIIYAAAVAPFKPASEDAKRLDWIEQQSNGSSWVARQSSTGRGFRLHNTGADDAWNGAECRGTARGAIDVAMKAPSDPSGNE